MKLKTLKEIREKVYSQCRDEAEERLLKYLFSLEDDEAIKWVKDEDKLSPSAQAGFKEFFNITEEDLKEKEK